MDLVTRLLLGGLQLTAACSEADSQLQVAPLREMIGAALSATPPDPTFNEQLDRLANKKSIPSMEILRELALLTRTRVANTDAEVLLEHTTQAIEALLAVRGVIGAPCCTTAMIDLVGSTIFRLLGYLVVASAKPMVIVVGSGAGRGSRTEIPIGQSGILGNMALAHVAGKEYLHWRTSHYFRLPPDPRMRRYEDWIPDEVAQAQTIEVYRRQVAGEEPLYTITNQVINFPHTVSLSSVEIRLAPGEQFSSGTQTTVCDGERRTLLTVEQVSIK